ncbi:MAG: tRNA lysidine(34) synthetase TilS [Acidiferrobacter sp.]
MGSLKSARFSPEWLAGALARLAITTADPLLVGFSGGLDSTALLHALAKLSWPALRAVHIDHGLRPESKAWGVQAMRTAHDLGVPCEVVTVNIAQRGQGIEASARAARYEALGATMGPQEVLVVAHHANDQAETMILQLLRGTGLAGAAGMSPVRPFGGGRLVRPLLDMTRAALADYAATEGLSFIEDDSNTDLRFARNYIRHAVWPVLERRWPKGHEALGRGARHLQSAQRLLLAYVDEDVRRCTDHNGALLLSPMRILSQEAQAWVLRSWIRRQGGLAPSETSCQAILAAFRIIPRSRQQMLRLRGGGALRRYRERVLWADSVAPAVPVAWRGIWELPAAYPIPGGDRQLVARPMRGQGLSADRLADRSLVVCSRTFGARVYLPGRGHRSLKKFLQELGIAPWERARVVLVFDASALIAIPGYWVCENYKAGPEERGWALAIETVGTL